MAAGADQLSSASDLLFGRPRCYLPVAATAPREADRYDPAVAEETRRIMAQTATHARAAADNLTLRGFVVESTLPDQWVLRKPRRRGDEVVVITIRQSGGALPPPSGRRFG